MQTAVVLTNFMGVAAFVYLLYKYQKVMKSIEGLEREYYTVRKDLRLLSEKIRQENQ